MILRLQITYKTPVHYNNILFSVQILFVTFFKLRTIQHTLQYSTVQYSTVQYSTVQYSGLHVKCRYCCQMLVKIKFERQIFEK